LAVFALMAVLAFSEIGVAESIGHWLGFGWVSGGGVVGGCALPNIIVAHALADRLFKAFGASRSGRMLEGRRPAALPAASPPAEDVVEIRLSRALSNSLLIGWLGMGALVFVLAEVIIPRHDQTGRDGLPWLYGLILGMAALSYLLRHFHILRADDQGIAAAAGLPIWTTRIPWRRIASCDLVVCRNTLGEVSAAYPVMKDAEGKELLRGLALHLGWAAPADQQRLLRVFKKRFPKLELNPWEC
jgi:hypothetical protein